MPSVVVEIGYRIGTRLRQESSAYRHFLAPELRQRHVISWFAGNHTNPFFDDTLTPDLAGSSACAGSAASSYAENTTIRKRVDRWGTLSGRDRPT